MVAAAALIGFAPGARAEDDSAQAKTLYDKGMANFQLEEYDAAIEKWQAGFRIKPAPEFLYNIAQAYRLSKRPELALSFYQKYLRVNPKATNKAEVEKHIAALKVVVAQQQHAADQPPTSTISPNDGTNKPHDAMMATNNQQNLQLKPVGPIREPIYHPIGPTTTTTTTQPTTTTATATTTTTQPTTTTTATDPTRGQVVGGAVMNGLGQVAVAATAPSTDNTPIYKKAWFWCVVGGAVVAIVVSVVVGVEVGGNSQPGTPSLPALMF